MKLKFIYVYDALCGWCYGFSPVIKAMYDTYRDQFDFEVLSGGMFIGEREGSLAEVAPFIRSSYKTVEETTGIVFGEAYLRHLETGEMHLSSEKPAIALSVFKSFQPENAVPFVHELQSSLYFDGKDVNDPELYRYLAVNHGIDPDEFEFRMAGEEYKQAAYYDFALAKQLQITGYPAALIQVDDSRFYLVAKGFTDLETLELRVGNVLKEISGKL